jgi:hypothetical protein
MLSNVSDFAIHQFTCVFTIHVFRLSSRHLCHRMSLSYLYFNRRRSVATFCYKITPTHVNTLARKFETRKISQISAKQVGIQMTVDMFSNLELKKVWLPKSRKLPKKAHWLRHIIFGIFRLFGDDFSDNDVCRNTFYWRNLSTLKPFQL